jgi:hypothetical protein
MTKLIRLLLWINIAVFTFGFYLQYVDENPFYHKILGSGVLLLVFVLLPLFLYHRYKDKSIEDFRFKNMNKKNDTKEY